jgi:YD repeat-containing protein
LWLVLERSFSYLDIPIEVDEIAFLAALTYGDDFHHGDVARGKHPDTTVGKKRFVWEEKGIRDPLSHVTRFTYTPVGLVETVTDTQNKVTRFEYDARGNRTAVVDALNQRTTFTYDVMNRLRTVRYPTSPATSTSFTYDTRGRRTSVTDQNGKTTTYSYDCATTTLDGAQYSHDLAGNRLSKTDNRTNIVSNYGYDPLYELTLVTQNGNAVESYAYDPVGNRLSSLNVPYYTHNPSNQLTNQPGVTYTYDNMET